MAIDFFEILHTRARRYDTVYISLQGKVKGQRSDAEDACAIQGPPVFCVPGTPQGNHDDGIHPVSNVRIGPFDLIPEIDEDLRFSYAAVNFGTSYNQKVFKKIMDGISDATAFGLSIYQPQSSGAWNQGNDFTHKLHELQWGGCDGPVANDVATVLNRTISNQYQSTLDAHTKDSGVWRQTSPIYEIESQDGCGKSSKYKIGWAIYRTSWKK